MYDGKRFLLIAGILYCLYGLFFSVGFTLDAILSSSGFGGISVFVIAWGVWFIIIGILGMILRRSYHNATMLMVIAAVDMVVFVLTMLILFTGLITLIVTLIYLPAPILYIIGAKKNKL